MEWIVVDVPTHRMPDADWVKAVAHIRKNETGEIRKFETQEILDHGDNRPSVFNWEENNFACNCNRHLFFERAAGGEAEEDAPCGDGMYSVNLENPKTGEIYYREFD